MDKNQKIAITVFLLLGAGAAIYFVFFYDKDTNGLKYYKSQDPADLNMMSDGNPNDPSYNYYRQVKLTDSEKVLFKLYIEDMYPYAGNKNPPDYVSESGYRNFLSWVGMKGYSQHYKKIK